MPHPSVVEAYYKDYLADFPGLLTAAWGFTVETATQGIRLVLSGVFDAYPEVKIILGHLGESLRRRKVSGPAIFIPAITKSLQKTSGAKMNHRTNTCSFAPIVHNYNCHHKEPFARLSECK